MNIFVLSLLVNACAKYHCDKHCIKMILETAQLLSTCHRVCDPDLKEEHDKLDLYKSTHVNHPCSKWLRESVENYRWLFRLFIALCDEFTHRRKKVHKCDTLFRSTLNEVPKNIPDVPMTHFALAMPAGYKIYNSDGTPDAVSSYRNYYIQDKMHFCEWTKRDIPYWVTSIIPYDPLKKDLTQEEIDELE
jgi:hypothetical protein